MKVFNEQAVARLAAANNALRWLRAQGIRPLAVELDGGEARLLVPALAGRALSAAASGFSTRRTGAAPVCTTRFLGCIFDWQP